MKKRRKLLLLVPACVLFLSGCDAKIALRNTKYLLKKGAKKVYHIIDDFFEEDEPSTEEVKVIYHF